MEVRTFEAFTMKDAVKSVKKALGADAVILATKEKPAPNGKGTVYEVTAAAAQMSTRPGASAEPTASGGGAMLEGLSARLSALAEASATKIQVHALEAGMRELKLLLIETLRGKDGSPMKDLPAPLVPLDRQMRVMGIDDIAIAEMMKHLRALPPPTQADTGEVAPEAYFRDQAIRWLMKRVKIAPRWPVMAGTTTYQAIVGPTGSGKTAIVAKLAGLYGVKDKSRVAVVSLDNHRLAASEQMRIFCKIIGVPFVAGSTPADVLKVAADNRDIELVLIDTAGVSTKDRLSIEQLAGLRAANLSVDYHLCLSITEKSEQLDQAVKAFAPLGLASLIFTKLDDSWSFGEIYNLSKRWSLPLGFFGIGQNTPDDIERATRERVVERIFGL